MEIVTGALPSVLTKLGELLVGEYNLQKEVKGGIRFLKSELKSMQGALEKVSKTPVDQLDDQDKIWAREVRELSYDIEDQIDIFMVEVLGSEPAKQQDLWKFIYKTIHYSLKQPKSHRKIAVDIRDIKCRVEEVAKRRDRYKVDRVVAKPEVDPSLLAQFKKATELVGIDEARDEVIQILMEGKDESKKQCNIVSIVGFGGLGKTTLANAVCEKLRAQFDCWAFVSVSQTPDMKKLFKDMLCQLDKNIEEKAPDERRLIYLLRGFLQNKRYFIIIDDIWDIKVWEMIKCALPDDKDGYRIITTTRISEVAKNIGGAYNMKPLCLENSRILFHIRIFGNKDEVKRHDELAEVSERILKKCGGVPLAIITIASLLASKRREKIEWYNVCNSIGTGLEKHSLDVDNMRRILSLSYYNMPSHLRACLLYLSVFPEDFRFTTSHLIWMWIAEGFIQCEEQRVKQFEMGEKYLKKLADRSMIQPIFDDTGMIGSCRVHDMVLDLIRSLSSEENFVTIGNDMVDTSASRNVRRLSLQNGKEDHGKHEATVSMEHVRSVVVFQPAIDLMPALQKFRVLRVLDLKGCVLPQGYSLKYLGNLLHLRYLGLRDTGIDHLPEEVQNLQFLQTLDIHGNSISSLSSTIVQLTHLMCLRKDAYTRVPNGIGSLTSIEELSMLLITDDSTAIIKELGHLTELRVLEIMSDAKWNDGLDKCLVECLNKLQKIQSLHIRDKKFSKCNLDGWVSAPQHLRKLLADRCWFSTLPAWVNPSLLLDLSSLWINVRGLQQEGLEILGRLPTLRYLYLRADHQKLGIHGRFTVGACSFPCLESCGLLGFGGPVVFQQGAMPRLTELRLDFPVRETRELNGGFDLGLENLPSLEKVYVNLQSEGASEQEVKEAGAAVRHAIKIHPNHPTTLYIYGEAVELETDDAEDSVHGSGMDEDEDSDDALGMEEDEDFYAESETDGAEDSVYGSGMDEEDEPGMDKDEGPDEDKGWVAQIRCIIDQRKDFKMKVDLHIWSCRN